MSVSDLKRKESSSSIASSASTASRKPPPSTKKIEDAVDVELDKMDGKIKRPKSKQCRHGHNSACAYCLALDPYDETYLASRDIKHMSFHCYLRKLLDDRNRGGKKKLGVYLVENQVCHVVPGCKNHQPFPAGSCTSCVPGTISLTRQKYRHVDNICFENDQIPSRFIDFWRRSGGAQRIGLLIGRYNTFKDVPLGIQATVLAIYEPPQVSERGGVRLLTEQMNEELKVVEQINSHLQLKLIGWVFTDLVADKDTNGLVHCTRMKDSYLVSAEECITAGWLQNQYPNISHYALNDTFGSKFVTVVVSGNATKQIDVHGYQVSNQCAALVNDNLLVPLNACPELAYVRDKPLNDKHYIPDVKFTEKDKYGNEVTKDGRPLPVEYLLVDVPCGRPIEQQCSFYTNAENAELVNCPIENREMLEQDIQSFYALGVCQNGLSQAGVTDLRRASDFHFLLFLARNHVAPVPMELLAGLLDAVRVQDEAAASEWFAQCEQWLTIQQLMLTEQAPAVSTNGQSTGAGGGASSAADQWQCAHCTFLNQQGNDCEMCHLPRQ